MRKLTPTLIGFLIFVVVVTFIPFAGVPVAKATASIIYVDVCHGDDSYDGTAPLNKAKKTIQAGIAAVGVGGTVNVAAGTYDENVEVNKENLTIASAEKHGAVIEGTVEISANGVTVDGFSIKNFSQIPIPDLSGVYIPSGTGITVANNLIDGAGTVVPSGGYGPIGINTLYGATAGATLEGNIVKNVKMGIYNQGAVLLISKNTIENTAHCGIGVDTDLGTTITGNTIRNSADMGIEVFHSGVVANYNNITGNTNYGVWSSPDHIPGGAQVDATNNWWDSATGPTHVSNPGGTGDAVSDNVKFDPWYVDDARTTLSNYVAPSGGVGGAGGGGGGGLVIAGISTLGGWTDSTLITNPSVIGDTRVGKKAKIKLDSAAIAAMGGVKVQFFVDGKIKKIDKKAPFDYNFKVKRGTHTVTVKVLDINGKVIAQIECTYTK